MWEGVTHVVSILGHLSQGQFGLLSSVFWVEFILCLYYFSQEFFIEHCDRQKTKLCWSFTLPKIIGHGH